MNTGRVIWITGLSGAGKTTLAKALLPFLPEPRILLDGDELREALAPLGGGYERADRLKLALTYAKLCLLAASQGQQVVCATVSLFHEVHKWNRGNLPDYFEVFLDLPPEILLTRDYKNVYQGRIEAVMGGTIIPELPLNPDLRLTETDIDPYEVASKIFNIIRGLSLT
jgi:adenylylsulfate kinase